MDRGSSAAALPPPAAAGARPVAPPAGGARLPAAGPTGDDAVRRRGAASQDRARAGVGGRCETRRRWSQTLHPGRANHRPAPGRRADLVPRARPAGRCRAHRAGDRAPSRRREAGRLAHRLGPGYRCGRRSGRGAGHSGERRTRRGIGDRPLSAGPRLMAATVLRVLIVEDSASDAELMVRALRQGGFEVVQDRVQTADAMRAALARHPWDVVLSDYSLPHFDAPAALAVVRATAPHVPFIVVSGSVGEDTAVAVMQAGAADYIMKDRLQRLAPAVSRAVEGAAVRRERRQLEEQLQQSQRMEAVGRLAGTGKMGRVLVNLAVNARDAMPQGGRLAIETGNVEVDGTQSPPGATVPAGRYVLLQVSDNGVGMDALVQAHVFEPFFTTKPRGKGTGLGLATVYGIVRQSGGHITVESTVGQGAMFRIYLPRVEAPLDPTSRPTPVAAPAAGTETILVAEDERLVRVLAQKVLERAGYRVLVGAGGADALALAERHDGPIHLLLTDVVMPEMNGRELARRLTAVRPGVRVLYMSGYADEAVAQHGVLDPGTAFLQKPFTPEALAKKVRGVLDGAR